MELFMYDPKCNITTKTTLETVIGISGVSERNIFRAKKMGSKLRSINCYVSDKPPSVKQRIEWYKNEIIKNEAWLPIDETCNHYVSDHGRIKKLYKHSSRLLLPYRKKGRGGLFVKIKYGERIKEVKVAHLVASHFIGNGNPGESVVHKNGIIIDDTASNLAYMSKHNLGKKTGGNSRNKPVVQIDTNTKEILAEFRSAREAGRQTHYSYQAILDRCNNRIKKNIKDSYTFMFLEEYEITNQNI